METTKTYSLTETAKEVRKALKGSFPGTRFSVRSKSYSGGCSINVSWTDGPAASQIDPILKSFEGATFDGMIDLKSYKDASEYKGEIVTFAPDYVMSNRSISFEAMSVTAFHVCKQIGVKPLSVEVKRSGDSGYVKADYRRVDFALYPVSSGGGKRSLSTVVNNLISGPQQPEELSQLIHQVASATSWASAKA